MAATHHMKTNIKVITDSDATVLGIENWIGTFGRRGGSFGRAVKTQKQAEAWLRRVIPTGYNLADGAFVWEERDYKGNACGWAAWFN